MTCHNGRRRGREFISIATVLALLMVWPVCAAADTGALRWPSAPDPDHPPTVYCRIVRILPHDPGAFTQGLVVDGGRFYESTGLRGRSSLRVVVPSSGRIVRQVRLAGQYFAEGLTILQDRIFQLTWKSGLIFVYDRSDLTRLRIMSWPFEGWGITHNGQRLIVSDGSHLLRFVDPGTGAIVAAVPVTEGLRKVNRLNELEYIDGHIWANVWKTDRIAVIDPATGRVAAWVSVAALPRDPDVDVANGIAYDAAEKRLYVTGKFWGAIYEVELTAGPQ